MPGKQLLTIACAVGILLCGACFLPPPPPRHPRPPRAHLNLEGARRILVTVTNASPTQHVDAAAVGRCVADAINARMDGAPKAEAGSDAKADDAVLRVSIVNEDAEPEAKRLSPDFTTWSFDVTISASLARADGTVVWSEANRTYSGFVRTANEDAPWTSAAFTGRTRLYVCDPMVLRMLSATK